MSIKHTILQFACKPKVLHQLPGRLRIHLPLMTKVPQDERSQVAEVADSIRQLEGIRDIQISIHTGNALVEYDPDTLDGKQIINLVEDVTNLLIRNAELLEKTPADQRLALCRKLCTPLFSKLPGINRQATG